MLNASGSQLVNVRRGANVTLSSPDNPNTHYHGSIVAVLGQVNPGSTNFIVKAQFRNPGYQLIAGVVVSATVDLRAVHGTGIPITAFLNDSHSAVMIVQNGTTHTATVHQLCNDGRTAVVSGLPAGVDVVDNGQLYESTIWERSVEYSRTTSGQRRLARERAFLDQDGRR